VGWGGVLGRGRGVNAIMCLGRIFLLISERHWHVERSAVGVVLPRSLGTKHSIAEHSRA